MRFLLREYIPVLPGILERLEIFTGASPGSVVLVPNATTGVNTVLSNLQLNPGDELLTTGQEYFASRNALEFYAHRNSAEIVEVPIDVPVSGPDQVIDSIMSRITSRTVLVLVDHISSATGMIYPIEELIQKLDKLGIDVLVDGAHGPGMVPLNLAELGAAYYTCYCLKVQFPPGTAAILYVRPDRQNGFRPAVMSHFASDFKTELSEFQVEFSWNGTIDPTPRMTIPFTIDYLEKLHPGGWGGIMKDNHEKMARASELISEKLGLQLTCPLSMLGSMGAVILSYKAPSGLPHPEGIDPLWTWLLREKQIEIPVIHTSDPPGRFLRFSAQLYNGDAEYEYLACALKNAPHI